MMDLTVAICMYNAEVYIERTLQYIYNQTMQGFYLLIVDDCSTDHSTQKVDAFFEQHHRQYELIRLNENQGIAHARNFAINHVTTKYFVFIDSDDLPLPTLIEEEYKLLTCDQEIMAVSSWLKYIDNQDNEIGGGLFIGDTSKEMFRERAQKNKLIFLPIQTMFVRNDALRVGGFRLDGFPEGKPRYRDYCEDLDLWTRLSDLYTKGKVIVTIPKVLYLYRKADTPSTNHFNMIIKMRFVKKNLLLRRRGEKEMTFIEFMNSMSEREMRKLEKDSLAADCLRNGVFYLKSGVWMKGIWTLMKSVWYQPLYIVDKINANYIKK